MTIWKGKLNTKLCVLIDYSYWPKFFNTLAIGQKYFWFYPTANFFMVNNWANTSLFIILGKLPALNQPIMWKPWIKKFFPHMLGYTSQRKLNKHSVEIKPY